MKTLLKIAAPLCVAFLLAGCAEPPQAEMDAANAAIEAARAAGADQYVPEEFAAAQAANSAAAEAIEKEKAKFLFHNYDEAKKQLTDVVSMANKSVESTEAKKAQLKAEIEAAMAEVKTMIDTCKVMAANAPTGKEGKEALDAINADIAGVDASMAEVSSLMEQQQYFAAQDKVKAAKEKAMALNAELTEVMSKVKTKGKK